jgi:hypothetical protein
MPIGQHDIQKWRRRRERGAFAKHLAKSTHRRFSRNQAFEKRWTEYSKKEKMKDGIRVVREVKCPKMGDYGNLSRTERPFHKTQWGLWREEGAKTASDRGEKERKVRAEKYLQMGGFGSFSRSEGLFHTPPWGLWGEEGAKSAYDRRGKERKLKEVKYLQMSGFRKENLSRAEGRFHKPQWRVWGEERANAASDRKEKEWTEYLEKRREKAWGREQLKRHPKGDGEFCDMILGGVGKANEEGWKNQEIGKTSYANEGEHELGSSTGDIVWGKGSCGERKMLDRVAGMNMGDGGDGPKCH